jgi:anthranilate 1,2-dioxygenase small subunit
LPRIVAQGPGALDVEAPFAVYQTDQEGETRLFATGLYRDRLDTAGGRLLIAEKLVLLDTAAIPTLLATPL